MKRCLHSLLLVICALTLRSSLALASISTFENYSEGSLGSSFTDSQSGITYSNATNNSSNSTPFIIDYSTASFLPPSLWGNHLTGNGYSPGPGLGVGFGIGFTATLPTDSHVFDLDVIHLLPQAGSEVSLRGFDVEGQLVADSILEIPSNAGQGFTHLSLGSQTPMHSVVVSSRNINIAFDNISIPEPTALLWSAASALLLRRRRR